MTYKSTSLKCLPSKVVLFCDIINLYKIKIKYFKTGFGELRKRFRMEQKKKKGNVL